MKRILSLAAIFLLVIVIPAIAQAPAGYTYYIPLTLSGGRPDLGGSGSSALTINGPSSMAAGQTFTMNGSWAGTNAPATLSAILTNPSNTWTGDQLFKSGRPWVDVRAEGAKCDGATDDTAAFNASVAALPATGGTVFVPQSASGCVLSSSWNLNLSHLAVVMDAGAFLILGAPVVIGSTTSNLSAQTISINVQGSATPPTQLVQLVNTDDDHLTIIQTANCACDLLHVQSVGGHGAADNVITVQSQFTSSNGVIFESGNATTASVAGDFVNGNVCWKCDLQLPAAGTGVAIGFRGTGTFAGSVAGSIARNVIWRSDISQFNGNGNCIKVLSMNATNTELWETTCETGGGTATFALDTTSCTTCVATGAQWRIYHMVMPGRYDQQNLGTQDTFWADENNNTMPQGTLSALMNEVGMTTGSPTTTSTAFVSSGLGINGITPKYLTTTTVTMNCYANNNTSGDGVQVELVRSTVGIPSNGGALGGGDTVLLAAPQNIEVGTSGGFNFAYPFVIRDTGLAKNTAVFYYLAYSAVTAGTAQLLDCSGWAAER